MTNTTATSEPTPALGGNAGMSSEYLEVRNLSVSFDGFKAVDGVDLTLMQGDPRLIVDAISLSKATYRKIQQNLFWAFVYNVIGIPLAALGYLNPMLAGAAMALSSVSVVTNSLMLKNWKGVKR